MRGGREAGRNASLRRRMAFRLFRRAPDLTLVVLEQHAIVQRGNQPECQTN